MAPSRRKGSGKAAAAAAATRRKWKVGDLVLAKVKGFPAWPATVSEPEKWGYAADWKKVLVYFFGTKQIAFCNPADVEEFTEEKKESLLTKRQGKGADFVRAVQEIVDSYEELKKQDQVDDFNSANDVAVTNSENLLDSSSHSRLKDQTEAPAVAVSSRVKTSYSTEDRSEPNLPIESVAAVIQIDSLHDVEALSQEPNCNMVVSETPTLATYSSRRRLGGTRLQTCTTQRRTSSARISRSLSRADSSRFQNLIMSSNDGGRNSEDIATNGTRKGSLRRNRRTRKSPEASEWLDLDSPNFVLNGCVEDNGSEIVTAESDTLSFNEGSTIESGCKPERSESVEGLEGDIELSKRFDLQTKAVVTKKKRKPNRKRVADDTLDTVRQDNVAGLEVSVQRSGLNSENVCEILNDKFSKEDGDEHLPLVKRARVRMGKLSSTVESLENLVHIEEKSPREFPLNLLEQVCMQSKCDDYNSSDRISPVMKECLNNLLLPNDDVQLAEDDTHLLTVKKNQPLGRSVDGEAALPPSKRLHRALEAMSANAAEDGQISFVSSTKGYPQMGMGNIAGNGLRVENVESLENGLGAENVNFHDHAASHKSMVVLPVNLSTMVSEETRKSSLEMDICNQQGETSDSLKDESCKDMLVEAVRLDDGKNVCGSSICAHRTKTLVDGRSPKHPDRNHTRSVSNEGSPDQLLQPKDENGNCDLTNRKAERPDGGLDNLGHTRTVSGPGSKADELAEVSPPDCSNASLCDVKDNCHENTQPMKCPLDENIHIQINGMCKAVKEDEHVPTQKEIKSSPSRSSLKGAVADVHATQHMSHSASPDEHQDDKNISGDRLSLSPTDRVYSTAPASPPSPPNTLRCPMSTSDTSTSLQNNGCCSPVHLHQEKTKCSFDVNGESKFELTVSDGPKSMEKWSISAEASAALTSFEAVLGTLTRTKESIGRATRIAIDCAKFGIAAKVVEILVRNLEKEASLHKRVDLFFLVDSITQCSRSLKGDVGGIYPSAIQSALPRLLSAAAPPGSAAQENRRQCLKVLRLWLERRILPESIVRHHMRDLDSLSGASCTSSFSRRLSRTERAFNDPIREMEGMLVDEYGSNSSFQLPGFCMPRMLKDEDEGSDSDGGSFEAVTPEHNSETPEVREATPTAERHRHILEDVDGELEMEDVAPSCEVEISSARDVAAINNTQNSHHFESRFPLSYAPPLPNDVPPSSPPLPTSPPPPPPPPPSMPAPPSSLSDSFAHDGESNAYNIQDKLQQSVVQQSVARVNSSVSETAHYNTPESRDIQMQMPDSANSSCFRNFPGSHHPMRPAANSVHQMDGPNFHNRNYHLRPPHSAPSNQFSYVQTDQRLQSRRELPPPPYPNRFHVGQNMDPGNSYNDHDGMKLGPHDFGENWRFAGAPSHGPLYHDKAKMPYSHSRPPYNGPHCEPTRIPNQWWPGPPRPMNHRNSMPIRPPPSEGAIPVTSRGPNYWRPR